MHIELTEMLKCPEPHREEFLVLSTGEMSGRMVQSGLVGCPVCHKEYAVVDGVVEFGGIADPAPVGQSPTDPATLQALLDLGGPGGIVVLVGDATQHAEGLASLMGGIHFVGINPPAGAEELPVLSLLRSGQGIPLRASMARGVVIGTDVASAPWLTEAHRVLLRGRRYVLESDQVELPQGVKRLAQAANLVVGEKS
jgi:hypothetical protein